MTKKIKDIGIDVKPPEKTCSDVKCPFHGKISVRGRIFIGRVISKGEKTVTVEWDYFHKVPKYERSERRKSRVYAYLPDCIDVDEGSVVKIAECRPLSKTKKFAVIEKVK